jgi:crotonobetainyl-CoA:carnitine CoA-transferase CaiB-like acyl-CoA transferase
LLRAKLASRSALEWEAAFGEAVPCAAVRTIEDMFDHPQVAAEAMVSAVDHPTVGRYRCFQQPIKFGRTPGPVARAAPAFGQHTAEVLQADGWSTEEIAAMRSS